MVNWCNNLVSGGNQIQTDLSWVATYTAHYCQLMTWKLFRWEMNRNNLKCRTLSKLTFSTSSMSSFQKRQLDHAHEEVAKKTSEISQKDSELKTKIRDYETMERRIQTGLFLGHRLASVFFPALCLLLTHQLFLVAFGNRTNRCSWFHSWLFYFLVWRTVGLFFQELSILTCFATSWSMKRDIYSPEQWKDDTHFEGPILPATKFSSEFSQPPLPPISPQSLWSRTAKKIQTAVRGHLFVRLLAILTCLLARSLRSLPCSWKSKLLLDGYFVCVFFLFWPIVPQFAF